MKKACIFCASSPMIADKYIDDARLLAQLLTDNSWGIVYGGGSTGLMGVISEAVIKCGGSITGVIPTFMVEVEWQNTRVDDMRQTETMAERKQIMMDISDGIVVLPGSTGTMDEFFEAMANKKLGLHAKPLVLLNTDGFFDHTIAQLHRMVDDRFMTQRHLDVLNVANTPHDVVRLLQQGSSKPIDLRDAAVK